MTGRLFLTLALGAATCAGAQDILTAGLAVGRVKIANKTGVGVLVAVDKGTTAAPGDGVIDVLFVAQTPERVEAWEGVGVVQADVHTLRVLPGDGSRALSLSVGPPTPIDANRPILSVQVLGLSQHRGSAVQLPLEALETISLLAQYPPASELTNAETRRMAETMKELERQLEAAAATPPATPGIVCRPCYPDPPPSDPDWPGGPGGGPTRTCVVSCPGGDSICICRWPGRPLCACKPDGFPGCTCRE